MRVAALLTDRKVAKGGRCLKNIEDWFRFVKRPYLYI